MHISVRRRERSKMTKRICLFAGYDFEGKIDDYVIYYCSELSKISDVYYYGDFEAKKGELDKLKKYVKGAYAKRHKKYDFGSWQELVNEIGLKKIREYDELIIANDSCFGPLFSFEDVFKEMNKRDCDFWGLSCSRGYHIHVQSYFLVFKKNVINDNTLFDFLKNVKPEKSLADVCTNYEERLAYVLSKQGFKFSSYIPYGDFVNQPYYNTTNAITNKKFPLLKVKTFYGEVGFEPIKDWKKLISSNSKYDISLITKNLYRRGLDDDFIQKKLYYGKRIGKKERIKNFIKNIIKKIVRLFATPFRKYTHHVVDLKIGGVINSFNYRIDELNEEIASLKEQIRLLLPKEKVKIDKSFKKYKVIDKQIKYKDLFLKDDYFVFRELNNILLNFDKYGKDILFLGNVDQNSCSTFNVQNNRIIVANSVNIKNDSILYDNMVYNINDLSEFELQNNERKVFFDMIFVEPFSKTTNNKVIKDILLNIGNQMLDESSLIMAVKYDDVKEISNIMTQLNFEVDEDGIGMFSNKIVAKMGYSVLFFRKKREYDIYMNKNEGEKNA